MIIKNYKSHFLGYFIIFGILITILSSLISYKIHMVDIEGSIKKYAQEISLSRKNYILKPHIERMDDIVIAIANNQTLKDFIESGDIGKKHELQNLFLTVTDTDKSIMQTRLIDKNGKEIIRINRDNAQSLPYIVNDSMLQDKSLRDYFQTVSKMTTSTIWHSRLDLNIENGKIEVPFRPTIRIAIPLYQQNKFAGMIICNMLSQELYESVENSPLFDIFIIDSEGYYILHPDSRYSWNKYTGIKRDLYEDFPEDAAGILAGNVNSSKVFVYPLDSILKNDDHAIFLLKPKENMMDSLKSSNRTSTLIVAFLSLLFSIPLAMYASREPSKLQRALHNSNAELKRFANIIDRYVITVTTKTNGLITSISTAFANVSGYAKEELIGKTMNIVRHPETENETFENLWKTISLGERWEGEIKNKSKEGRSYWLKQTIVPIKDENDMILSYMSVGIDISAKKELETLALIDKLTNLFNRRKIDECLYLEVEKSKRFNTSLSIIMIDIDYFKKINDTFGHQTGDLVLQKMAEIIKTNTRNIDCCGRYGGEEFMIVCPGTPIDGAMTLAEQIRKAVDEYTFETVSHLTVSLGVSSYIDCDDMMTLIKRSDEALYMAKLEGRNKSVYL